MKRLLQINTSLSGDRSASSKLADAFVAEFRQKHPENAVVKRDLGADPVPHLDGDAIFAFFNPDADLNENQRQALERSNLLIREVRDADVLVLGVPMYNLGVPSPLKAWIDHIARARVTFRYASDGTTVGYLTGKKAYIMASRGGFYAGTANDVQTEYLIRILALVGIVDVEFVYAEGMGISEEQANTAFSRATQEIANLVKAADLVRSA